jgi:hypothetical protein
LNLLGLRAGFSDSVFGPISFSEGRQAKADALGTGSWKPAALPEFDRLTCEFESMWLAKVRIQKNLVSSLDGLSSRMGPSADAYRLGASGDQRAPAAKLNPLPAPPPDTAEITAHSEC